MNKKLKLQDFTFLINIIKDQDNWNIQDLADKLTVDLDTLYTCLILCPKFILLMVKVLLILI